MKACVIAGKEKLQIVDCPVPQIEDDEVLIRVERCGTCFSEFPLWKQGTEQGKRIGHEPVGIVEKVGSRVSRFVPGERVTGMFYEAFAEYTKAPERNVIKVPDSLSTCEGIGEPLSCLMSGVQRTPLEMGDTLAVVGCGFMGNGFLQLMRLRGAGKIIGIDLRPEALENARRFGANETYLPQEVPACYLVDTFNDRIFLDGVDVAAEVSGTAEGLALAGVMPRAHGTLDIVGYHQSGGLREVDMKMWNWKAMTVINAHERRDSRHIQYMAAAMRLIEAGQLDIAGMYTHEYALDDINQAFRDMENKPHGYIKGSVRIG